MIFFPLLFFFFGDRSRQKLNSPVSSRSLFAQQTRTRTSFFFHYVSIYFVYDGSTICCVSSCNKKKREKKNKRRKILILPLCRHTVTSKVARAVTTGHASVAREKKKKRRTIKEKREDKTKTHAAAFLFAVSTNLAYFLVFSKKKRKITVS